MTSRIDRLENRLVTATAGRIMAGAGDRLKKHDLCRQTTPQRLAATSAEVERALRLAIDNYPYPVRATISKALFSSFLVSGIVIRSHADHIKQVRSAIFRRFKPVLDVCWRIHNGEKVPPRTLRQVQDHLYGLTSLEADRIGINKRVLSEFDHSFFKALVDSFPWLKLERAGFAVKDWSTREQAVANIRFGVLRHNPDIEEEILKFEEANGSGNSVEKCRYNEIRQRLLRIGKLDLGTYGLGAYYRSGYFEGPEDAVRRAFPLLKLTSSKNFLAGFDLTDKDDLNLFLGLALERAGLPSLLSVEVSSPKFFRPLDLDGDRLAMRSILKRVREVFCETWEAGKCLAKSGRRLEQKEFRRWLQELVLDSDIREKLVLEFLYILQNRRGNPEDIIKMNSSFIARYGTGVINDLFGMDLRTFLRRNELFKDQLRSKPKNTLPKMLAISDKVAIMEGEVTAGLFRRIMQGYEITGDGADDLRAMLNDPSRAAEPLTYTSLMDGRALARRFSKHTGRRFRVMARGDWDLALDNKVRQKMSGYHWNWAEEESSPGSGFYQLYSLAGGSKTSLPDFRYPDSAIRLVEDL
ncbi:hypothetical protein HZC35_03840 [Candidatus Saganbacteria bacterium]|nr:hypothetical protein [Candidatus Saganbacteria bacterium]